MKSKKMVKGMVAGALGLSLLLGGGTFALWYDSQSVAEASVNSGELGFTIGTQSWKNGATPIDIATYKIVPGDVLTLTSNITIGAVGDNLKATLSADTSGVLGDAALSDALTFDLDVTGLTESNPGQFEVTSADNDETVVAVLTITLPQVETGTLDAADQSNWWGSVAQNEAINLSSITFELAQHL
jgi:alternate signal-mediated exported protein